LPGGSARAPWRRFSECRRPPDVHWPAEGFLPSGSELAAYLAGPYGYPEADLGRQADRHASEDNTARIWDAETGKPLVVLRPGTGPGFRAVFSPDGRYVAAATRDDTAWLYPCRVCGSLDELVVRAREQLARGG
jgi:WD40 repeat protein